jgi:hypothetical protein
MKSIRGEISINERKMAIDGNFGGKLTQNEGESLKFFGSFIVEISKQV